MNPESIKILEENKEAAMSVIHNDCCSSIFLQGLVHVYLVEIDAQFPYDPRFFGNRPFPEIKALLTRLYEHYNNYLANLEESKD